MRHPTDHSLILTPQGLEYRGQPVRASAVKKGYLVCHIRGLRGWAYYHRLVVECKLQRLLAPGEEVDHINQDKTDNTESNLRVVSRSENHYNKKQRNVYWDASVGWWKVKFKLPNKRVWNVCVCKCKDEAEKIAAAIHRDLYPVLAGLR